MEIRNALKRGPRVQLGFDPETEGRTKQSMAAACDINNIMARFVKTGAVEHGNQYAGSYGYATSQSYHEALSLITKGDSMFADLPAALRGRFNNDVGLFLDFVQDPENLSVMSELGLSEPEAARAGSPPAADPEPPAGVSPPEAAVEGS